MSLKILGEFDTFVCCFGMYWFQDPLQVIQKIEKLLIKDGHFLLLEENFFSPTQQQPVFASKEGYLSKLAQLESYYGIQTLIGWAINNHLSLVKQERLSIDKQHELVGMVFEKKELYGN